MRTIEQANTFKKDFKSESEGKYRNQLSQILPVILNYLVNDLPLEPKLRDHDLIGNWQGYRECHLKPDLLLVYRKEGDDVLKLARLGSHSEIFG
jgi:mRNA interferase YafQ